MKKIIKLTLLVIISIAFIAVVYNYLKPQTAISTKPWNGETSKNENVEIIARGDVENKIENNDNVVESETLEKNNTKITKAKNKKISSTYKEFLKRKERNKKLEIKWRRVYIKNKQDVKAIGNLIYALYGLKDKKEENKNLLKKCLRLDKKNELCLTMNVYLNKSKKSSEETEPMKEIVYCLKQVPTHYHCLSEIISYYHLLRETDLSTPYLKKLKKYHKNKSRTLMMDAQYHHIIGDLSKTNELYKIVCGGEYIESNIIELRINKEVACSFNDYYKREHE
jgi:hypothetical protein